MKKFDIKGVVSGLCVGVLATLVLGAGLGTNSNSNSNSNQLPVGRFQIYGTGALFAVVDTSTGQVWLGDFHSSLDGRVPPDILGVPAARDAFFGPKLVLQNNGD